METAGDRKSDQNESVMNSILGSGEGYNKSE